MTRCDHTFELFSGEYIQCSRPTGHDGDHHFEVPPLDAALKKWPEAERSGHPRVS